MLQQSSSTFLCNWYSVCMWSEYLNISVPHRARPLDCDISGVHNTRIDQQQCGRSNNQIEMLRPLRLHTGQNWGPTGSYSEPQMGKNNMHIFFLISFLACGGGILFSSPFFTKKYISHLLPTVPPLPLPRIALQFWQPRDLLNREQNGKSFFHVQIFYPVW